MYQPVCFYYRKDLILVVTSPCIGCIGQPRMPMLSTHFRSRGCATKPVKTPAPPQNVWRVLDNKAALNAGKVDEASCTNPAGEKVPNKTDAGESKAVAVHLKGRSMSDIGGSQLVRSIEDIR